MLNIITHQEDQLMSQALASKTAAFPNDVRLNPVESSWIKAVGYQPEQKVLYVMTKDTGTSLERIYPYFGVDALTQARFLNAPSKGAFYNQHIRGQFKYDGEGRVIDFPNQADLHRVVSRWIKAVGYNKDTRTLYLMTRETESSLPRLYPYFNVDEETFNELLAAESKGSYYNAHIKNHYAVERII